MGAPGLRRIRRGHPSRLRGCKSRPHQTSKVKGHPVRSGPKIDTPGTCHPSTVSVIPELTIKILPLRLWVVNAFCLFSAGARPPRPNNNARASLLYLNACKADRQAAVQLYEYNTLVSEGMYGVIQPLEVALRNSIHHVLQIDLGHNDWYDRVTLAAPEPRTIAEAKSNILRWGKSVTPGRVVAELTFGFWVRLVARKYEKSLWVPHLFKCFRNLKKPDRRAVFDRLDHIRNLRNRVAHHEPIFARNLQEDYRQVIEALDWICPVTACWIRATNSFQRRLR